MKHTPPSFFPEIFIPIYTMNWEFSWLDRFGQYIRESHVSVTQSMLQSLMSLWKETHALSSSTLLSRDGILASNILGSGGWCVHLLNWTHGTPSVPLLCRCCFGSASGISSIALGGANKGSALGKSYSWCWCWWVTAALISNCYSFM